MRPEGKRCRQTAQTERSHRLAATLADRNHGSTQGTQEAAQPELKVTLFSLVTATVTYK